MRDSGVSIVLGAVIGFGGAVGCRGDFDPDCPTGTLGCACTDGGGCDPGLSCLADACADPGDGGTGTGGGGSGSETGDGTGSGSSSAGGTGTDGTGDGGDPQACDVFRQDCPAGFKCNPTDGTWATMICVPLADEPVGAFEPCTVSDEATGQDDCVAGTSCYGRDDGDGFLGTCHPFCDGQNPCGPSSVVTGSTVCLNNFVGGSWCFEWCLPQMGEDACPAPFESCTDATGAEPAPFVFVCDQRSPTAAGEGGTCTTGWDCQPGLACVGARCTPYCDDDQQCSGGTTCQSMDLGADFQDPPGPGPFADVRVCR